MVFLGAIALFWLLGIFDQASDGSSQSLIAVSALVGLLVSETIVVVGILVKDSVDRRTADLAELELRQTNIASERNRLEARAEADRNRTDTVIRAVQLIGDPTSRGSQQRISGMIAALLSLDELELALVIVEDLWPENGVTDTSAFRVIDDALKEGRSVDIQHLAVIVLHRHSHRIMSSDGSYNWPTSVTEIPRYLDFTTRLSLVNTAHEMVRDELRDSDLTPGACSILFAFLDDEDLLIRSWAALALSSIYERTQGSGPLLGGRIVTKEMIKAQLEATEWGDPGLVECHDLVRETVDLLDEHSAERGSGRAGSSDSEKLSDTDAPG